MKISLFYWINIVLDKVNQQAKILFNLLNFIQQDNRISIKILKKIKKNLINKAQDINWHVILPIGTQLKFVAITKKMKKAKIQISLKGR